MIVSRVCLYKIYRFVAQYFFNIKCKWISIFVEIFIFNSIFVYWQISLVAFGPSAPQMVELWIEKQGIPRIVWCEEFLYRNSLLFALVQTAYPFHPLSLAHLGFPLVLPLVLCLPQKKKKTLSCATPHDFLVTSWEFIHWLFSFIDRFIFLLLFFYDFLFLYGFLFDFMFLLFCLIFFPFPRFVIIFFLIQEYFYLFFLIHEYFYIHNWL